MRELSILNLVVHISIMISFSLVNNFATILENFTVIIKNIKHKYIDKNKSIVKYVNINIFCQTKKDVWPEAYLTEF